MKTNNFKLAFKEHFITEISFGNARFVIIMLDSSPYYYGQETFSFRYDLNGVTKIFVNSEDLPGYYQVLIRTLYYGRFAYDKSPFYKSPALECISIKRSIENYLKRVDSRFITNIEDLCVSIL